MTGGSSWWRSERLIRAALDLGFRRFDVAPSYGLGTAERTLGLALGNQRHDPGIEITTKYGLLPRKYDHLKSFLREPYRFYRSLSGGRSVSITVPFGSSSLPDPFTSSALEAAHRSRRALGVERIAAFLSHERLPDQLRDSFTMDIESLKANGLISRGGCSGELFNVRTMLSLGGRAVDIAQTSIDDVASITSQVEMRAYGIRRAAERLCLAPETTEARLALRDLLADATVDAVSSATLAAALTVAHRRLPTCSFLFNAGSVEHLKGVIEPILDGKLDQWVDTFWEVLQEHVLACT